MLAIVVWDTTREDLLEKASTLLALMIIKTSSQRARI